MGRKTENYSRRSIVILFLCLIYLDVWDLFIYLLFIICSTLVFILSALLPLSVESFVITHHGSDFGVIFYFSLRSGGGAGFFDYFLVNITRVKDYSFFLCFWRQLVIPLFILVHDTIGWVKIRAVRFYSWFCYFVVPSCTVFSGQSSGYRYFTSYIHKLGRSRFHLLFV